MILAPNNNSNENLPWTMTLNDVDAMLPDPSLKVYVTVVLPTGKNCPGKCDLAVNVTEPELSVAVGSVQITFVPPV